MKLNIFILTASISVVSLTAPVLAENLQHTNQLLATKQCQKCDLSGSGLVMANLPGANLAGANLSNANLSRANLAGADLRGANLTGASLYGANLSGANLSGAIFNVTDLRDTYLINANLSNANLANSSLEGAIGIPNNAGSAEQFQQWGIKEASKTNYAGAIEHFNSAIAIDPEYAPAYLARAVSLYRLGNESQAKTEAQKAIVLFSDRDNEAGKIAAENFIHNMELAREIGDRQPPGNSKVGRFFSSVASMALQFLQIMY